MYLIPRSENIDWGASTSFTPVLTPCMRSYMGRPTTGIRLTVRLIRLRVFVPLVGAEPGEVIGQSPDGGGVGAAVVVDHHHQPETGAAAMLLSASHAMPPVRAPSPTTATTAALLAAEPVSLRKPPSPGQGRGCV